MKIFKRIIVIIGLILLGAVVGYLVYTGSQLSVSPAKIGGLFL